MSGTVKEPDITPLILKLKTQGLTQNQIDDRIIKFFDSYDQSQEKKIEKLNQKLFDLKSKNKRIRNKQAEQHTEKSEYENLFLDCVDECKKEVLRQQIDVQSNQLNQLKKQGISGSMLLEQVCTNKEDLIVLFEELFGTEQA